ncbi:hypothetical protein EF294_10875 [Gordonia oryzae]|uniref:Uncharacterized protein n=1 Tax=Gordonia oryzae TaxID=2487349 RepID=A0A3N4GR77_9ACTN|nr:hypothetical protein [Gordonia oryzae]RPA61130.1 hypothetical protein EF294_10875 [Gordonia oryzae]
MTYPPPHGGDAPREPAQPAPTPEEVAGTAPPGAGPTPTPAQMPTRTMTTWSTGGQAPPPQVPLQQPPAPGTAAVPPPAQVAQPAAAQPFSSSVPPPYQPPAPRSFDPQVARGFPGGGTPGGGFGPGVPGGGMPGDRYRPPGGPRNTGALVAIGAGVLTVVVIVALAVTLIAVNTGGSTDTTVATGAPSTAPSTPGGGGASTAPDTDTPTQTAPDTDGTSAVDPTTAYAIADAMQRYIVAANARDVAGMQAAVCSAARSSVQAPTQQGNLVLEQLRVNSVDGDTAQSTIQTHVEVGSQRSSSQQASASFERENSTWYYCPGAEPAITA